MFKFVVFSIVGGSITLSIFGRFLNFINFDKSYEFKVSLCLGNSGAYSKDNGVGTTPFWMFDYSFDFILASTTKPIFFYKTLFYVFEWVSDSNSLCFFFFS